MALSVSRLLTVSCAQSTMFSTQRKFNSMLSSKICRRDNEMFDLVYRGPISGAVRAIKVFSLSTCGATITGLPVLIFLGKLSVVGKLALACVLGPVGLGTTFLLHLFVRGYVTSMWYNRTDDVVRVYTLSLLASNVVSEFRLEEVDSVEHVSVLSSFTVNGRGFFIHPEVVNDAKLLEKLLRLHPIKAD